MDLPGPENFLGNQVQLTLLQPEQVRKNVVWLTPVQGNEFQVQLFRDTEIADLQAGLQPKILPPFWLGVKSISITEQGQILQVSGAYLRETSRSFQDYRNLLERLLEGDQTIKITGSNPGKLQIFIRFIGAELPSVPLKIVQAVKRNVPRPLRAMEIEHILSALPELPTATPQVGAVHQKELLEHLRAQLTGKKISPLQLQALKTTITDQYLKSLIQPHEQVGIETTMSLVGPLMQSAMNARHKFGQSAGMTATIELYEKVLLNQGMANPEMTIAFENRRMTDREILQLRHYLEEVTIRALVMEEEILPVNTVFETLGAWWWNSYLKLHGQSLANAHFCLSLQINPVILYEHHLTMQDLVKVIHDYSGSIVTIPSPILHDRAKNTPVAYLNIFCHNMIAEVLRSNLIKEMVKRKVVAVPEGTDPAQIFANVTDADLQLSFLRIIVLPEVLNRHVSGIVGISEISAKYFELISTDPERMLLIDSKREGNRISLTIDPYKMRRNCLKMDDLLYFLGQKSLGFSNLQVTARDTIVGTWEFPLATYQQLEYPGIAIPEPLPKELIRRDNQVDWAGTVIEFLLAVLAAETKQWKLAQKQYRVQDHYYIHPLKPLNQANRVYIAQTVGSNLKEVCLLDFVDPYYTFTNDPKEMLQMFGIEVAMCTMIRSLLDVLINTKNYIDLTYVMLICEIKCNLGITLGTDYHGLVKLNTETLSKATAQQAVAAYVKTASTSKLPEDIQSVSSAVLTGSIAKFGAGAVEVIERGVAIPSRLVSTMIPEVIIPQRVLTSAPKILSGSIPLPPEIIPRPKQDPEYQLVPQYTQRASQNISVSSILPRKEVMQVPTLILPRFEFLGLTLPEILNAIVGPEPVSKISRLAALLPAAP